MKATGKCPKCASESIVKDALVIDRGHGSSQHQLTIATFGNPRALLFKQEAVTTVSAWVCAQCGFIEFYADEPQVLHREG